MRKIFFIAFLFLSVASQVEAQYGNEWIDYNKSYFKVSTARDGIYRISYADLQSAGFPVTTIDPRRIQLFYRGQEVAIHIQGQGDAVFNSTDYIEFHGERNDGSRDALLYSPTTAQPHPYYNLFTDTTAFFLTYHLTPLSGKRMASYFRNNTENIPPETAHRATARTVISENYALGRSFSFEDVTQNTFFDQGEGWTGIRFQEGQNRTYLVNGITSISGSGNMEITVFLAGRDDLVHNATILAGPDEVNVRSLGTVSWNDYATYSFTATISPSDVAPNGNLVVRVQCNGVNGENDLISVSYVEVNFDQQFNAGGTTKKFTVTSSMGNPDAFLQISNVPAGALMYDISDRSNVQRVGYVSSGNNGSVILQNAQPTRELLVTSEFLTPDIQRSFMRDLDPSSFNYLIITHPLLRQSTGNSMDPVLDYGTYRASAEGGGYDTIIVNVDELFNQYNYGETSPLALYEFLRRVVNEGDVDYLFLIGKGMDASVNFHRNPQGYIEQNIYGTTLRLRDLVPSAGMPGADMYFTAGLDGTEHVPAIPTGRIPAVNAGQVSAYLEKVKTMESQPYDDLYRKDVLHLSGGISALELVVFNRYMNDFGRVAENLYLGGNVETIRKDNTEVVQLININNEVNDGQNLITFFGHSAPFVTDIDIGFVSDPALGYNNPDKYPMFLINGCQAGQFFSSEVVFGEDWILAGNKGAIGFIAHSSYGFSSTLRRYTEIFYETAYSDTTFMSLGIGDIQKEVARRYINQAGTAAVNVAQAQQMVLLGDPATALFGAQKPDYETNSNQLFISTANDEPLTNQLDEIYMNVIVRNFGQARRDSLLVEVTQTLRDNSVRVYDSLFQRVYYQDTLRVRIPLEVDAFGNNQFQVRLDPENALTELNENNNSGILNFFIPSNATRNLFPLNFGIIPDRNVTLTTSSTSLFPEPRSYSFEIDTSAVFNSPARQTGVIQATALASWEITLAEPGDSTVYYWRTKYTNPAEGESNEWQTTSFTFIENGPEGWTQREYPQFIQNRYIGLQTDAERRKLVFQETPVDVSIYTGGSASEVTNQDVSFKVGGTEYSIEGQYCRNNTINFIAFDRTTAVPYLASPFPIRDPRLCGRQPQIINSFSNTFIDAGDLANYIDAVDEGDVILAFTIGYPSFAAWSTETRTKLTEIGLAADEIQNWIPGEPIIIAGRKGSDPGSAVVIRTSGTPASEQDLTLLETVIGYQTMAMIESVLVGPASQWNQLFQRIETSGDDQTSLRLMGVTLTGEESVIFNEIDNYATDLASVDATQFPYLRLQLNMSDEKDFTAPVINDWLISYEGVPEGYLLPEEFARPTVSLEEGETFENSFQFINISSKSFTDSLTVRYELFNRRTRTTIQNDRRIPAPDPGDTTRFTITTETAGNAGDLDYTVFVNPFILPEQYYDNNLVDQGRYFTVNGDNVNPVIDVVFDGEYIMDGDIVSPTPFISARMVDNNDFLLKQDTVGVNLLFKENCQGCTFRRISFSSPLLNWYPASEDQPYRLEFRPERLNDGIYTLQIEASDASGNTAGDKPYEINFQVINESSITNFYPYPNPFSTSTRFVFTLTGAEIPTGIKIQIMTVTGKVVREILQDELGPVHIGNNITDYAWDGRDEFGDKLANGVYLYRVVLQSGGEPLEHRATGGDRAFEKGVGKLYILR